MGLINWIFGSCPTCKIYREWISKCEREIEVLRADRKEEKQDRRDLEDNVFKYVRLIRDNGHVSQGDKTPQPIIKATTIRSALNDLANKDAEEKRKYWEQKVKEEEDKGLLNKE